MKLYALGALVVALWLALLVGAIGVLEDVPLFTGREPLPCPPEQRVLVCEAPRVPVDATP